MNIKSMLQLLVVFVIPVCLPLLTHAASRENDVTPMLSLLLLVKYKEVTSASGLVWLDRNLGAARVATSPTDSFAYGDLYQWGRLTDGHEKRSSSTLITFSATDIPGHGYFIVNNLDWRVPKNDNLWQGAYGINNPCPDGFRIPTVAEFEYERTFWISNDAAGAFASPLKLVVAGYRNAQDGTFSLDGLQGFYWSSTVDGDHASNLSFSVDNGFENVSSRNYGLSVRCIKD